VTNLQRAGRTSADVTTGRRVLRLPQANALRGLVRLVFEDLDGQVSVLVTGRDLVLTDPQMSSYIRSAKLCVIQFL